MSKRLLALMLVGLVSLAGLALAQAPPANDEPPVRLKKKKARGDDKPTVDPNKAEEKKKDDKKDEKEEDKKAEPREAEPVTPQEEEKEVLQRVVTNVHRVGELLAKSDLGEVTQQTQRDILKDLESLIHRNENPPPQSGQQQNQNNSGGGGADNQDNKDQQGGGGQQDQKEQTGSQQNQKQQGSGQKSQGQSNRSQKSQTGGGGSGVGTKPGAGSKSGPKQQRNSKAEKDGKAKEKPGGKNGKNGNGGGGGDRDDRTRNKNADLDKQGVWGHLPQTLRAQMDAYSNPQPFMPKYDDLIKRYYKTISEQGRRKGE
jgi:hypothetical protein